MRRFENKTALVTGGGSGIGRATAIMFAQEGASVVIGNRNEAQGAEVVKAIKAGGGDAVFQRTDVTRDGDVKALVQLAVRTYGRLDAAFNNAGYDGELANTDQATEENLARVLDVNVKGVFLCMKHEVAAMLASGGGSIVNCSSIAGVTGFPGMGAYVASKHAVMGLTRSAALEYATAGIRVNTVNPAVIKTAMADHVAEMLGLTDEQMAAMHPMNRTGTPEEVASAVLYLCSDDAAFMTGQSLMIDGGYTAK